MSSDSSLNADLLEKMPVLGLILRAMIGICVGVLIVFILVILSIWIRFKRKTRKIYKSMPVLQIPSVTKEIPVDIVGNQFSNQILQDNEGSTRHNDRAGSGFRLPESSHLSWGHSFTLRDLELTTSHLSNDNVLGEGGYGVVYCGRLINGQEEKEFIVEVEVIGHVRHKNLVRHLGYCIEGIHRMLVHEYVNNGNLEQWLLGAMHQRSILSWEKRMKVILGTVKALSYLYEAIEPKVVSIRVLTISIFLLKILINR
ncbi:hypothetical protein ZIOFF_043215 [Zingiber officinale]|uniref:Protein kinase domain-containing protein n=1 Tax=Zingiber officinale TaxID=94328 RepID=A0A8J5FUK2_ZINOF|nr:hypothetical protein ZIOFF_043215 [Zingiber officinale]